MENVSDEQKDYYSVDDVLKKLGICRATLYKEIRAGRLQIKKVRRRTIILKEALDKYIDSLDTRICKYGH